MKKIFIVLIFTLYFKGLFSETVIRVLDGDTYELSNGEKVRMIGINAPELHNPKVPKEPYAEESLKKLEDLILNKEVNLEKDDFTLKDYDKFGRLLRYTFLNGVDIHKKMISEGYAKAYLNYRFTKKNEYILAENSAKNLKKGMYNNTESESQSKGIFNDIFKTIKQEKSMEFLLLILFLFLIAFGGYFIIRYFRTQKIIVDVPTRDPIKIVEAYSLNNEILQAYEDLGRTSATQKLADTGSLKGELDTVYSKYQDFTSTNKENRIAALEQMNKNLAIQNNKIEGELERYNLSKEQAELNLEENRQNRQTLLLEGADTGFDLWIKIGVLTVVCLGLLAFLFSIYTTAFYEVFFGKGTKNLLTGFDFSNLDELGNMSKISVICFPLLFLAIAVLIDTFIKIKKYFYIFLLGSVTFIVDLILALMNAKKSYDSEFLSGIITSKFSVDYWSSNLYFWIFIFTATAGYIIWGFIFHHTLILTKSIQQPELIREQLKIIDDRIAEFLEKKIDFSQKLRTIELERDTNIKQINENEHNLALIKNGAIVIIWSELLGVVGKFMSGWNNFVKFYFPDEIKSKSIIESSTNIKNMWLKEKENSNQFNSIK